LEQLEGRVDIPGQPLAYEVEVKKAGRFPEPVITPAGDILSDGAEGPSAE
jgi:hypothetical protein